MKKRHLTTMVCFCAAFVFFAGVVLAQDKAKGERKEGLKHQEKGLNRGDGSGIMGGDMQDAIIGRIVNNPQAASEFGLSEEQIQTLKASMEDMRKQNEVLQKQLKDSGLEQAKLMTESSVDEQALFAAVEKAGKVRTDMAKARITHMLTVKKTLKPEQINKIREMVQNRVKQMRNEGDAHGLKNKGDVENAKDRLRERMKKRTQDENKSSTENPADAT